MQMQKFVLTLSAAVIGCALAPGNGAVAQEMAIAAPSPTEEANAYRWMASGVNWQGMSTMIHSKSRAAIEEARRALRDAESDEARAEASAKLREALATYFDKDVEARKNALEDLRKRIVDMESLLQKRLAAKDEIVALQLQMFTKEAEGMGFFGGPTDAVLRGPTDAVLGFFPADAPPAAHLIMPSVPATPRVPPTPTAPGR